MSTALATAAWPACTSALRLDRFLAGELPPAEADELRGHLDGCARCAAALAGLTAARDATRLPPLRVVPLGAPEVTAAQGGATPRLTRRRRVVATLLGGLAAAAGLMLMVRSEPPAERTKGRQTALAFGVYVLHDGAVRRAGPGEVLAPGDALRFAVKAPGPGYVAVLSVDPAGKASVYYPAGDRAEPVAPGALEGEVALPLATRLDATVGEERLYALFCEGPVELEPVRAALEGAGADGAAPPAGCQVTRWRFEKR